MNTANFEKTVTEITVTELKQKTQATQSHTPQELSVLLKNAKIVSRMVPKI